MVAGGQESMSNVPFYVKREPLKYGGNMMIVSYCRTSVIIAEQNTRPKLDVKNKRSLEASNTHTNIGKTSFEGFSLVVFVVAVLLCT